MSISQCTIEQSNELDCVIVSHCSPYVHTDKTLALPLPTRGLRWSHGDIGVTIVEKLIRLQRQMSSFDIVRSKETAICAAGELKERNFTRIHVF